MLDFDGKTALVTGASRGLGRALLESLATSGVRAVAVARDQENLERAVREVRSTGAEAHAVVADVADKWAAHRVIGAASALVGPLDLLVHNASTLGRTPLRLLLDTECEDLEHVLQTNLVGPFRLTKLVAGAMALRGTGLVLHISSDAAVEAYPTWGAYSVSKAAHDHLMRVLAQELANTGVRVLNVDPGEMDTSMHHAAVPDADRSTLKDPREIATRIVGLLQHADRWQSGARVEVAQWHAA